MTYTIMYIESVYKADIYNQILIAPLEKAKTPEESTKALSFFGEPLTDLNLVIFRLMKGFTIVYCKKEGYILQFNTVNDFQRAIEEPSNEKVIRGSHEGLVEALNVNIGLIRKRLEHPSVQVKYFHLGKYSNTKGALIYIKDLANNKVLDEVHKRLTDITTDYIQSPGFVEEYIEDYYVYAFPTTAEYRKTRPYYG